MFTFSRSDLDKLQRNVARFNCMPHYRPTRRYMWNPVETRYNSSQDIRGESVFIDVPPKVFGIFQHTGRYGNYTNMRVCPLDDTKSIQNKQQQPISEITSNIATPIDFKNY